MIRPSVAGPIDALPPAHESLLGSLSLKCATAPTEKTFFAHAWPRENRVPVFDWLWVIARSWSNRMSSTLAESVV